MQGREWEDVPADKNWSEITGGQYDDPDHPLNKHDEGQMYSMNPFDNPNNTIKDGKADWGYNEQDVNENSAGEGAHKSFYEKLNKKWVNKIKGLEEPQSQIKIDDTIPSDFVELSELRNGAIYKVAKLNLIAKLVNKQFEREFYNPLLKMSKHGIIFYVEEGSLMKATDLEVETYLEESK